MERQKTGARSILARLTGSKAATVRQEEPRRRGTADEPTFAKREESEPEPELAISEPTPEGNGSTVQVEEDLLEIPSFLRRQVN